MGRAIRHSPQLAILLSLFCLSSQVQSDSTYPTIYELSNLYGIHSAFSKSRFGAYIAALKVDNGDIRLAVSAPGEDQGTGAVYVYTLGQESKKFEFVVRGLTTLSLFGEPLRAIGDVNQDGYEDFLVGTQNGVSPPGLTLFVFSGADGSLIYKIPGVWNGNRAGDVNNDGVEDIVASDHGVALPSVQVFSGADGMPLHPAVSSISGSSGFGVSLGGVGDVNNDGFNEIIVGDDRVDGAKGAAYVLSGADMSVLKTFKGADPDGHFGINVAVIDRKVIIASFDPADNTAAGTVDFFDIQGKSSAPLFTLTGSGSGHLGRTITDIGTIGGKHLVLLGEPGAWHTVIDGVTSGGLGGGGIHTYGLDDILQGPPGRLHFVSTANGAILHTHVDTTKGGHYAQAAVPLKDLDSDGSMEFAVGAPLAGEEVFDGEVTIESLLNASLVAALGMRDSSAYGEDSPGCLGKTTVSFKSVAKIGSDLQLEVANSNMTSGFVLAGVGKLDEGITISGVKVLIDLQQFFSTYPLTVSGGLGRTSVPVPDNPELVGSAFFIQGVVMGACNPTDGRQLSLEVSMPQLSASTGFVVPILP